MANALCVISFICSHPPRPPALTTCPLPDLSAACERFKLCRFMGLAGKKQGTEWYARAITQQMYLGTETTFGTA